MGILSIAKREKSDKPLAQAVLEQTMRYVKFAEADISAAAKHSPADNWKV